jgi:hypothetical protein
LNDDDVVFVEVLALVDKFHGRLQKGFFYKIKTIALAFGAVYQPARVIIPPSGVALTIKNSYSRFDAG